MIDRRIREMQPDPANRMLRHPAGVWMFCVGSLKAGAPQFRGARRNRENQPWLEILGPLDAAGTNSQRFIGSELEMFLAEVQAEFKDSQRFIGLGPEHFRWQAAGTGIARASQLLASGQSQEGAKLINSSIATLPPEVQEAFGSP